MRLTYWMQEFKVDHEGIYLDGKTQPIYSKRYLACQNPIDPYTQIDRSLNMYVYISKRKIIVLYAVLQYT